MRVLDTFMAVLIIGISGSVIAQETLPSSGDIKILTTEECEKNGGSETYNSFPDVWENFANCSTYLSPKQFETDLAASVANGEWDTFVKTYCGKLPSFIQCASSLIDPVKPCLDSKVQENVENIRTITSSLVEYACQNDGNRVASFFTNGGISCLESKQQAIRACPMGTSSDQTGAGLRKPIWVKVGLSECAEIESYGNCVVGALRTCENPTPADVVQHVFDHFKTRKSCPSIPATTASPVT